MKFVKNLYWNFKNLIFIKNGNIDPGTKKLTTATKRMASLARTVSTRPFPPARPVARAAAKVAKMDNVANAFNDALYHDPIKTETESSPIQSKEEAETAETVADKIRKIAMEAREKRSDTNDASWKDEKNNADIKLFFNTEVKKGAMEKIEKRAVIGCNNANILEYKFDEYFYVKDGKVVRTEGFQKIPNTYLHKIYKVMKTDFFQSLMKEFINTLGDMCYECWAPAKNLNVIEVYWGPTKNHAWDYNDYDDETEADDDDDDPAMKLPDTLDTPDEEKAEQAEQAAPMTEPGDEKSYKAVVKRGGSSKNKA